MAAELADVYAYLDLFAQAAPITESLHDAWRDVERRMNPACLTPVHEAVSLSAAVGRIGDTVKKLNRNRDGIAGNKLTQHELRCLLVDQIGAAACALHRLAKVCGIDLAAAVILKFNCVSERNGFPERVTLGA
jgi:predicted molibdopterin-dependent oxidoreductase YjgC